MRNNQILYDAGSLNINIDEACFYRAGNPVEQTRFSPAENGIVADGESYIDGNIKGFSLNPEGLRSIYQGMGLALKVSVLLVPVIIWAVIAVPAVILYFVFYKYMIARIINKIRQDKRKSPYYYKWKNHHLDLNWEA